MLPLAIVKVRERRRRFFESSAGFLQVCRATKK